MTRAVCQTSQWALPALVRPRALEKIQRNHQLSVCFSRAHVSRSNHAFGFLVNAKSAARSVIASDPRALRGGGCVNCRGGLIRVERHRDGASSGGGDDTGPA